MAHHLASRDSLTYILFSIILFLSQAIQADIESTSPGIKTSTVESNKQPRFKPTQISLDENVDSRLLDQELEPRNDLQELLSHEKESHFHLDGEIMLDDDASVVHPSLHDIDGFEIDITIDFE